MPAVLDLNTKIDVAYCIPTWLRDEQVRLAIQRPVGRLGDPGALVDAPCAVVCFGPSLADTWEDVRKFTHIFSCSGSHKFLVDHGIIPTWHVEVDPRPHKVELIGTPQPETEYLIASACHPKVFDHLAGYRVTLWHVFSNEEEAGRILPRGEWAITGGSSVGLRTLTLARFFGFTNLHVFGMDGSEGATGKHAAPHPNQPKGHSLVEVGGQTYRTTPAMLECAKQTFHELNQLKDVKATFYGDGLVQTLAREYQPNPVRGPAFIGMSKPALISAEYADLNRRLHRDNLAYGVGGGKHADMVLTVARSIATHSILDYGCGKGYLAKAIPFPIWEYDPAIPEKTAAPRPADVVVCTDVLEHIEPEHLGAVLDDLRRVTRKVGYFVIHTGPAGKTLADGRNTHLIQRPRSWWEQKLAKYFKIGRVYERGMEITVLVGPKGRAKQQQVETMQAAG